ncbi:conjugal transfer protein [Formosa sp. A9]|uniref:conjugal transfer protein n=1 Tax=Formosa sp. A9 TaxID=3442641 RepID=UPI003EBC56BF
MKPLLLTLVLVLNIQHHCFAQGMPVYDNTNFISLAKSLIESAKQTSQLIQTVNFLKDQKENIEKVNAIVKQLKAVKALTENNQRLFNMVRDDLRNILDSPYVKPEEVERISQSFNAILDQALDDLDFIDQILSSDLLKMTDGERTAILKEREKASKAMVSDLQLKTERYRDIIAFRKMQDLVNHRDTNY